LLFNEGPQSVGHLRSCIRWVNLKAEKYF
jgi:hypothetical protein